ncbi:kinase-like domain-containing protein [Hyaloraphidium curvatum]|nr:kinase-like domain-containing protein [Hyaloraphidium curvatum]
MISLAAALSRAGFPASTPATRLGGLTNHNYLVEHGGSRFVLRIPGPGTAEYIDRISEADAARSAAEAGVNAEVVFFDRDGLMVTKYVEGARTMSADAFRDLDAVARAGCALRRLHTAASPFAKDFDLFGMIDGYKAVLATKKAALPEGYDELQTLAADARAALLADNAPKAPCHCDPLCENFLDAPNGMRLVDYEYAGNNDPMWDLADLSVEGGFSREQESALLRAYFGGPPPAREAARVVVHKAMCDLLWTLWGAIQHADGNPAEDFWAYAVTRFGRCRELMATEEFAEAVALLSGARKGGEREREGAYLAVPQSGSL